jgi:hypothetical protein
VAKRAARPGQGTGGPGPMWPDGPSCRATLGHRAQLAALARPYATFPCHAVLTGTAACHGSAGPWLQRRSVVEEGGGAESRREPATGAEEERRGPTWRRAEGDG